MWYCMIEMHVSNSIEKMFLARNGSARKPILKNVADMPMPAVIPCCVARHDKVHGLTYVIIGIARDKMHVIAHQAPSNKFDVKPR